MTQEAIRSIGLGFALVDEKVICGDFLPQSMAEVDGFMERNKPKFSGAGGSIANTMSNFATFADGGQTRLFCSVGEDRRGLLFSGQTSTILGQPQIDRVKPTGVCVFNLSQKGSDPEEVTYYGAAESVSVPRGDVYEFRNNLFVTNINACKRPAVSGQVESILRRLDLDGGVFALRLSGATYVENTELLSLVESFRHDPQVVFSNNEELEQIAGKSKLKEAMRVAFPNTRLLVVTLGGGGSMIRFEGEFIFIPPGNVSSDLVVDTTGAGDSYMGIMLGALFTKPYSEWVLEHVVDCARTGTYAASLVIQGLDSRLSEPQVRLAKSYYQNLGAHG